MDDLCLVGIFIHVGRFSIHCSNNAIAFFLTMQIGATLRWVDADKIKFSRSPDQVHVNMIIKADFRGNFYSNLNCVLQFNIESLLHLIP